jgi:hypothetical protein
LKKHTFFTVLFWLVDWLCISKMICKAWEDALITFSITQNGEKFKKSAKVFDHRPVIDDGPVYPSIPLLSHIVVPYPCTQKPYYCSTVLFITLSSWCNNTQVLVCEMVILIARCAMVGFLSVQWIVQSQ